MAAFLDSVDAHPGGADVIITTVGDKTFDCGRRTAAHLAATHEAFEQRFPELHLHIVQPCYNRGVKASAKTHDEDGVIDWTVTWKSGRAVTRSVWWAVQRFLREWGWCVWFRHTGLWANASQWHLHGISEGCPGPVGDYIPAQVDDYYRHSLGLAGQHASGLDVSWFPPDIRACRFDFEAWEEDHMDDKTIDKIADRVVTRLLDTEIGSTEKWTIRALFGKTKTFLTRN